MISWKWERRRIPSNDKPDRAEDNGRLAAVAVGEEATDDGTDERTELEETGHDTVRGCQSDNCAVVPWDSPLVQTGLGVCVLVSLGELGEELLHREDNGEDTLVEPEQKTTKTGAGRGTEDDGVGKDILDTITTESVGKGLGVFHIVEGVRVELDTERLEGRDVVWVRGVSVLLLWRGGRVNGAGGHRLCAVQRYFGSLTSGQE